MDQIRNQFNYVRQAVLAEHNQPDADRPSHNERVLQLIAETSQNATAKVPGEILRGRFGKKPVIVDPQTFDKLVLGKGIADAVKALINKNAPNQRLGLMQSGGLADRVGLYARFHLSHGDVDGTTMATNTIVARTGVCAQHAQAAYLIAKSLNLRAALVVDRWNDHMYVLIDHDGKNPVMVDPWAIVPTSCLASESSYKHTSIVEECEPHDPVPSAFNLPAIEEIRDRLEQKVGSDGFENAMAEVYRNRYGIRSNLLDRYCLAQGVMRYDRIDMEAVPEDDRPRVLATREKIKKIVEEKQLTEVAMTTHKGAKMDKTRLISVSIGKKSVPNNMFNEEARIPAEHRDDYVIARSRAEREAQVAAFNAACRGVLRQAVEAAEKSGTKRVKESVFCTVTKHRYHTENAVTVGAEATMSTRVDPYLWDERHTANTVNTVNTYESEDGRRVRFDKVSPDVLEKITQAVAKAREKKYPDAYIKRTSVAAAPLRRAATSRTTPQRQVQHISRDAMLEATIRRVRKAIFDIIRVGAKVALLDGTPAQVGGTNSTASAQDLIARQQDLVHILDQRVEHLPADQLADTLYDLAEELPYLRAGAREDALELLRVWMVVTPDAIPYIESQIAQLEASPGQEISPTELAHA